MNMKNEYIHRTGDNMRKASVKTKAMTVTITIAALASALTISLTGARAEAKTVGKPFPAMTLPKLNGKGSMKTTANKGKVVIYDFWASWCEPCKVELPALNELQKKYKSKGLVVVGVNMDEKTEDAKAFLKEHPVEMTLVHDGAKKALATKLEVEKMPTSFIVDKKGIIALRHEAFKAGDEEKIEAEVVKLLKAK